MDDKTHEDNMKELAEAINFKLPKPFGEMWYGRGVDDMLALAQELIIEDKLTPMNKLTPALKRALSQDKQTLYKAGLIGQDLELTQEGQSDYVDALFNNEGDHKKAVAEMVEMASDED